MNPRLPLQLLLALLLPVHAFASGKGTASAPAAPVVSVPTTPGAIGGASPAVTLGPAASPAVLAAPGAAALPTLEVGAAAASPLAVQPAASAAPLLLPAAAVPAPAAGAAARPAGAVRDEASQTFRGRPTGAAEKIGAVRRAWEPARASDEEADAPATPAAAQAERLRQEIYGQLAAMKAEIGDDPLFDQVLRDAAPLIDKIEGRLLAGEIDPSVQLRYSDSDPVLPASGRRAKVAVYPVAADPFQWAHLLIGLQAVAELGVDKVVFVMAGDDPRKPTMTPVETRHPMGRAVLERFAPFFAYSPIAVGTLYDGETNIFRLLALNPDQEIDAFYIVGDDHYKVTDKKGNPDTIPKLERNSETLGFNRAKHRIRVAFTERETTAATRVAIPTRLDVSFLRGMSFPASSTQVRQGQFGLMPYAAFEYVRRHGLGLYGIGARRD